MYSSLRFSPRAKALFLTNVSIAAFIVPLASTLYLPAQVAIQQELQTSESLVSLSITLYYVSNGLTPLLSAPIADIYGRRLVLIGSMLLFTGACIGLTFSPNISVLNILRFVQGMGAAGLCLLSKLFTCERVPKT